MKTITVKTINEQQTRHLAELIAEIIPEGTVVALDGDLAAGKSVFSSSALRKLGVNGHITSPTYTIINEYETTDGTAYHMDAYRLTGSDELDFIGYYDAVENCRIMLIEWAEIISDVLPEDALYINIEKSMEEYDERIIRISSGDEILINKLSEALHAYIIN
ncbi:MAG: tRNA (adenosine(37)-N6)-threonylcarbamoyltransferase complex ATPase subunit type 1 TsaE [Eubacteriaceae bacterium]|nr:tRNA (adenosine(37)-N6)-threonylcarbamoyltransferase complex ATPase subunit type 1 TsaE [Eubacteriaceae bacterium]